MFWRLTVPGGRFLRLTVPRGTELLLDGTVKEEGRYGILYEVRIGNPGRCEVLSEVRRTGSRRRNGDAAGYFSGQKEKAEATTDRGDCGCGGGIVVVAGIVLLLIAAAISSEPPKDREVVYEGIEFRIPGEWKLAGNSSSADGLVFYTNRSKGSEMLEMVAIPDATSLLELSRSLMRPPSWNFLERII